MLFSPPLWLYLIGNLILLLVITGILVRLACKVIVVQGTSMMPTLVDGDSILVADWWPKRFLWKGQIVIATTFPLRSKELHVKRIVATAGETVVLPLNEIPQGNMSHMLVQCHNEHGLCTWHIPPRHVFIRGDNRKSSIDSVLSGPLPYEQIKGVVLMKIPSTFLIFSRRPKNASAT